MTMHPQTTFLTADNYHTDVDFGMYSVLCRLRDLGVRTQYSCQGTPGENAAYVLADAKSFRPLLRKIKKNIRNGSYSPEAEKVARELFSNRKELVFVWFYHGEDRAKVIHRLGRFDLNGYSFERQLDNRYGYRMTLRWPTYHHDLIFQMLCETQ